MRTVIFMGLMEVAFAIYKLSDTPYVPSKGAENFAFGVFIIVALMDICEFLKKMDRD